MLFVHKQLTFHLDNLFMMMQSSILPVLSLKNDHFKFKSTVDRHHRVVTASWFRLEMSGQKSF